MSDYSDKAKSLNGVYTGGYAVISGKGGDSYGICIHHDIYYHFNCVDHNHKKITPARAES